MSVAGFVTHTMRPDAAELRAETMAWLRSQGHSGRELVGEGGWWVDPPPGAFDDVVVAVSLGGDGTMLRAVDLCSPRGIPVLGVNLGHLGYLTTVEPAELAAALVRFFAGDYTLDARMTLDVLVRRSDTGEVRLRRGALNDVVLTRPAGVHTVRAAMGLRAGPFIPYTADSLIIATPTGSTAYNLSARGPILSPSMRALVVTPVAPHMLFDRSLIFDDTEQVCLKVTDSHPADLVVDGRAVTTLDPDEELVCSAGRSDALLVTFGHRDFHHLLKRKFNLSER